MKKFIACFAGVLGLAFLLVAYNALRHLVYWTPHEDVRFPSDAIELAATFVKPEGSGPFPAVVMLHGSGPAPRADPTTRAVINALVRHGFAVLAYDKRGVGKSEGDFESALYRDFIEDATAAVDYLARRPDVDGERLGLYTVSESGWFGPEIASRRRSIRFIFNKVGSVLPWTVTVAWEVRNELLDEGVPPVASKRMAEHTHKRWRYYIATAANPSLASGPEREALEGELADLRSELTAYAHLMPQSVWPYDAEAYASFAANASYDPSPFLAGLDIPLFYAYAGKDVNVPTTACVAVLEQLSTRPGADITVRLYPDLGHGLVTWKGLLHAGFPPDYLETLGSWAASRVQLEAGTPISR